MAELAAEDSAAEDTTDSAAELVEDGATEADVLISTTLDVELITTAELAAMEEGAAAEEIPGRPGAAEEMAEGETEDMSATIFDNARQGERVWCGVM